ncbi:MAG TPA: helix-turn-helix domain-containing protein [Solirubrobacterales bacterium]|nr:helix-turn-helix domain-containing protein [Solirubrobacterales bacterium]
MARPQLHLADTMLDAARGLLLEQGAGSATVEAIAGESGAPTGSIYHRFGSRDELLARLWLRAVYRSQAAFLAALEQDDPRDAALAAAMSIVGFCEAEFADARLLASFRREDLIRRTDDQLAAELEGVNKPVERAVVKLARRLYGRPTRGALNRTLLAVFDLPYGATHRYLLTGTAIPRGLRADLEPAVLAVVGRSGR